MTDPNVIEALNALGDAVAGLLRPDRGEARRSLAGAVAAIDLLAAEKPAAPATPALPWVVRDLATGHIYATCPTRTNADNIRAFLGESRCEVAPAAIVPVTFDANDAAVDSTTKGREWAAEIEDRLLTLRVCLRPGEDAGVTTAKILAACGRGP